ncbi:MAG: LysM peptidoglycan-binding domain-containing protein [Clostridiales bacterium]|nr:LysM peptidoglycan-binding domain-containing protein [Clostridiales bacterium]
MIIHVVQPGDTVYTLARLYGVSPQRIISDNNLVNPQTLVVGQALLILIPLTVHTVQRGETLDSIADSYGTTSMVLLQNNPQLIFSPVLQPGQQLTIRFDTEKNRTVTLNAYAYPYIRREVLKRGLPCLTYLTIFGYGFTPEGDLIPIDDQPLIQLAYQFKTAPVMLLSSITEDGNFSSARASLLFQDPMLQEKVLNNVLAVMLEKGYLGLDVDFEYIPPEDGEAYIRFLQNVTARLHPYGFFVNTDLAPKTSASQEGLLYESHDYAAVGAVSDTVLLMTYEWGYAHGPPMAVAPLNQVRRVVQYAVSEIPVNKILMGLPNYGYVWRLPFERGITQATPIGNAYAVELAARNRAFIQFDETAQSPFFEYRREGVDYVAWFEDVRSIEAKFALMDEFQLLGGGYWNLMRPFAQNWAFVSTKYDIRKVVP